MDNRNSLSYNKNICKKKSSFYTHVWFYQLKNYFMDYNKAKELMKLQQE
ncbi:MAG: hypothetical protein ACD_78C00206G0004, partial [uncultured bacterium (gcode 4)]